jgi:MFS family permease
LISTFRSLSQPNFRLYFFGQLVSVTGTWMQSLALAWLMWRLTHSSFMLGMIDAARLSPIFLFALVGGNLADKIDRRRILFVTQSLALLQATTLAYLTISGRIQPWQAIALAFFMGTLNSFELPARQSFMAELVDREDMVNAISLSSTVFSLARSMGPALAGILVIKIGEGGCFAINAVSYLATIVALMLMRITPPAVAVPKSTRSFGQNVQEAAKFAFTHGDIRRVLLQGVALSIFGLQYTVLLPVYASEVLHGNVETLGWLRSCAGLGALTGALRLASSHPKNLALTLGLATAGFSLFVFLFAFSNSLYFSLPLIFCIGFCMTSLMSGGNSLVQISVPDNLRARVMSIYVTIMLGIAPLGSCVFGMGGAKIGAQNVTKLCAGVCLITGLAYLIGLWADRRKMRANEAEAPSKLV